MKKQLATSRSQLEDLACKHKEIKNLEADFLEKQTQFDVMCAKVGVDPLASNKVWDELLGICDFYELGVQIVDICLVTRPHNGGLISLEELRKCLDRGGKELGQGLATVDEVQRHLSWSTGRAMNALEMLLEEGLAVIDDGHRDDSRRYWFRCVSSVSSYTGTDSV